VQRGRTLARQLLIGFLAVTVPATLLLGGVTIYSLRTLDDLVSRAREIALSLEAARELQLALLQAEDPLEAYLLGGNEGSREEFARRMAVVEARVAGCAAAPCHGAARTPAAMVDVLRPALDALRQEGEMILSRSVTAAGTTLAPLGPVHAAVSTVHETLQPMSETLRHRADDLGRQAQAVGKRATILTGSLTVAIVLLACAAAVVLADRISRPLRGLLAGTRRVMAGDWDSQVRAGGGREIEELAASFNAMLGELRRYRDRLEEHSRTLEETVRERAAEVERKDKELMQSEKLASLGLLVAGLAHEINGPLTSIVMKANLLLEDIGRSSPLAGDLEKIDADAARCRRIIDDLRAFARRRELRAAAADIEDIVDHALWSAAHELEARAIRIERELDGVSEVCWDPDRMAQVLTNLFVNAAHAMDAGGRLTVRASSTGDELTLEVADTGRGIPARDLSRIFDPFFTTKPDGTGLGLSISHGIVSEHGGRIEVTSRAREDGVDPSETGTTVRIVLPVGVFA
jgi:signal transduction histidine kinase